LQQAVNFRSVSGGTHTIYFGSVSTTCNVLGSFQYQFQYMLFSTESNVNILQNNKNLHAKQEAQHSSTHCQPFSLTSTAADANEREFSPDAPLAPSHLLQPTPLLPFRTTNITT